MPLRLVLDSFDDLDFVILLMAKLLLAFCRMGSHDFFVHFASCNGVDLAGCLKRSVFNSLLFCR